MAPRLQLQSLLETILGSRNVYFQPPPNVLMKYPAIVYHQDDADTKFADNKPYSHTARYQVTVIHEDPDNEVKPKVAALPMCLFDRSFAADDLNHSVYNIFF